MDYMIDYLRFSIRVDEKAASPYPYNVDIPCIASLLGFSDEIMTNFTSKGRFSWYKERLSYNGISISLPDEEHEETLGLLVDMTGEGCRYFEKVHGKNVLSWYKLFKRIRNIVCDGCHVNICRLDIAFDEICTDNQPYLLDLDEIRRCAEHREYISRLRKTNGIFSLPEVRSIFNYNADGDVGGRTVTFGKRSSNTFLRFYDKFAEQLELKYFGKIENAPDDFKKITHWSRMEFEFKNQIAVKIVNAMLQFDCQSDFTDWLCDVVNNYICFINPDSTDNEPIEWWRIFIGTCRKASLKCGHFSKSDFVQSFHWLTKSLAPTLAALLCRFGNDDFIKIINTYGDVSRWTKKHHAIADTVSSCFEYNVDNNMIWLANIPLEVLPSDYFSSSASEPVFTMDQCSFDDDNIDFSAIPAVVVDHDFDIEQMYVLDHFYDLYEEIQVGE